MDRERILEILQPIKQIHGEFLSMHQRDIQDFIRKQDSTDEDTRTQTCWTRTFIGMNEHGHFLVGLQRNLDFNNLRARIREK